MADIRICAAAPCDNRVIARGLCEKHYRRLTRRGSLDTRTLPNGTAAQWIDDVALKYDGDACLIWPFTVDKDGYARGQHPVAATHRAHRVICILAHGEPPSPAHEAAHSCGKGHEGCVARSHLSWKLPVDNSADRLAHGTHLRGERGSVRKLTWVEVDRIRALGGSMTTAAIGEMFGVSQTNISMILRGVTWKEESRP